jgi:catechol 2,3-dioxygenase-like lactoylglutathione lyase family enzyme
VARAQVSGVHPILPVRELARALDHYTSLGFDGVAYDNATDYGFATRDGVAIYLMTTPTIFYADGAICAFALEVDDATALFEEWSSDGVGGSTTPPKVMPWGVLEGTHIDPDGNVIRYLGPTRPA